MDLFNLFYKTMISQKSEIEYFTMKDVPDYKEALASKEQDAWGEDYNEWLNDELQNWEADRAAYNYLYSVHKAMNLPEVFEKSEGDYGYFYDLIQEPEHQDIGDAWIDAKHDAQDYSIDLLEKLADSYVEPDPKPTYFADGYRIKLTNGKSFEVFESLWRGTENGTQEDAAAMNMAGDAIRFIVFEDRIYMNERSEYVCLNNSTLDQDDAEIGELAYTWDMKDHSCIESIQGLNRRVYKPQDVRDNIARSYKRNIKAYDLF